VIYVGNLQTLSSGYAQAALNHLCSLVVAGYEDIVLFPRNGPIPWTTMPAWVAPLRSAKGKTRNVVLVHDTPDQLASTLARDEARFVGMTSIDCAQMPRWAAVGINKLERLIVPSAHSKAAALASGVQIPVHHVPHPLSSHVWEDPVPDVPADRPYTFYYIGSWNARKNPEAVLRAFCRAFPDPGEARLSFKLTAPESVVLAAQDIIREEAGKEDELEWTREDIVVNAGYISEADLREYHAYGDCYVSGHRGEAFGLAILEAAVTGHPVIATAYGGPLDFLSEERGDVLVEHELVPVVGMSGLMQFGRGLRWAEPSMEALQGAMRKAFEEKRRNVPTDELRRTYNWKGLGPVFRDALGV